MPYQIDFISQGAVILLLGTKEEITDAEPIERPKFIEDMNESELALAVLIYPLYSRMFPLYFVVVVLTL